MKYCLVVLPGMLTILPERRLYDKDFKFWHTASNLGGGGGLRQLHRPSERMKSKSTSEELELGM